VINHIDLTTVLRRTVCDLYSDLVTRPTGAAVRTGIEQQLEELDDRSLTVIDFSRVGLLDFSCADEIVAKLLLRQAAAEPGRDHYFVFRGLTESHREAVETVLERHGLAIVAECSDGTPMLLGDVEDGERIAWSALVRLGHAAPPELALAAGLDPHSAAMLLEALSHRRVAMRFGERFVPLEVPPRP
jgi:hypothetical protein